MKKYICYLESKQSLICSVFIAIAIVFKLLLFPFECGDYIFFLEPWVDFIKANSYLESLEYDFYNYTPAYIYILIFIAKLGINPLWGIKIVSVLFEYLMAYYLAKILYLKYKDKGVFLLSFAIIPLLPTVLINGSYWGQCDSIYVTFIIASLFYFLAKKEFLSVLFLGIAFSLKAQTIFIFPFYFVCLLRGEIKWYYFLTLPLVYLLSVLPAWAYGRSLEDLLSIYLNQSNHYKYLVINFPNIYVWFSNEHYEIVKNIGLAVTFVTTLICGFWLSKKSVVFTFSSWVKLAFLSSILIPFILPGMHERYMYLGDILGVLYFLLFRKKIYLSIGVLFISFYSYLRCTRFNEFLPLEPVSFIYLGLIVLVSLDFFKSLESKNTL